MVSGAPECEGLGLHDTVIRAIRDEFGRRMGCLVRIWPHARGPSKDTVERALVASGFRKRAWERPYRTLYVDLSMTLPEIRASFLQKWRNCLNKAEKSDLQVIEGTGGEVVEMYRSLDREMRLRKGLGGDGIAGYERIQGNLPEQDKMIFLVCLKEGTPVAGMSGSIFGRMGIYMLGASGDAGKGLNGSYLLQWRMIERMKAVGVVRYDLGAFNEEKNPSVYHFKQGLAGRCGWEETFLHGYELHGSIRARAISVGLRMRSRLRREDG